MKIIAFLFICNLALAIDSSQYLRHGVPPLNTVPFVQMDRFVGKWFVIATLPNFFSKGCRGLTAEYKTLTKDSISVLNTCLKEKGKISTIKGEAMVVNPITHAELMVTLGNFITKVIYAKGDFTIMQLDQNYEFAMVGSKDRKSLNIMSRRTTIPRQVLDRYLDIAKKSGFDLSKLVYSKF
jgi:apolipoprotein D and lipocalin family protein